MKKNIKMISFMKYGYQIEIRVAIDDKTYTYIVDATAWSLGLEHKKYFTFRDLNKLKRIGRLVITKENI